MTDLHTHILPAMDDGARDVETSLAMLAEEMAQGVQRVALTPHFYRDEERPERFLARRQKSWDMLRLALERSGARVPKLILGAEVNWVPGLHRWEELGRLCLGNSRFLLLELPDVPWRSAMIDQIYDMMDSSGVTPVLAHLDRYFSTQKPDYIRELLCMGAPVQISAEPVLHLMQRGKLLRRIGNHPNCMLISDCHNLTTRRPNLGPGMVQLEKRFPEGAAAMKRNSRRIFELAAGKECCYAPK